MTNFKTDLHINPYIVDGSTDLIVFIHGSMDRGNSFIKTRSFLPEFSSLVYDRRGYRSSMDLDPPVGDISQHVQDLLEILDQRKAFLVGHSFGSNIALSLAEKEPALVTGIIAYEPPLPWLDWWPPTTPGGIALSTARDPNNSANPDAKAAEEFIKFVAGERTWESLPEKTKQQRQKEGAALTTELFSIEKQAPYDFSQIHVPVIGANGSKTNDYFKSSTKFVTSQIQFSSFYEIDGANHGGHITHPEQFSEMVRYGLQKAKQFDLDNN